MSVDVVEPLEPQALHARLFHGHIPHGIYGEKMETINSGSRKLNVALAPGLQTFKDQKWLRVLAATSLLLTAVVAGLLVAVPQVGQAQGAVPAQPTGLAATAGNGQASLTWDDPSDSSITGYEYLQAQVAKLTASNGAAGNRFGVSVAVDGDTAVVGAPDEGDYSKGAAYVLTRQAGAWSQVAKLTASDRTAYDWFGWSVAVEGDTVVVGAFKDADNGPFSGSAYVFTKPNGGWGDATETAKLTASDGAAKDQFGYSVGVDGDTVVVGAFWDDDNGADSGSAYVFTKPNGGWATATETAKLTASDGAAADRFGWSVAVEGNTVVVGANRDDDNGSSSGSAYVFIEPNSGGWVDATETAKLTASDGASAAYFGYSVGVDGDTVAVGAYHYSTAYVFTKPDGGWADATETAQLTTSDGAGDDRFGASVAVDGDTVVVGARQDSDNGADSGSAYVFTKPSEGWADVTEMVKLTASDGASDDNFGRSVAVDGDTVVVGAHHDDDNGADSGSAYVYEVSDWTAIPDSAAGDTNATSYTVTGLTNGAEYGFGIRAANNVGAGPTSDAVAVILVPAKPTGLAATAGDAQATLAWDDPSDSSITGYEYLLHRQVAKLTASDGAAGDWFGNSIAVDGETAVVGAWENDNSKGAAYVFIRQSGTWSQVAKLTASDGAAGDDFGSSVAVDGDTVVVGAVYDDDEGSAYVFTKPNSGWATVTEPAKLTAYDGAGGDRFGVSVAVDGDTVVVGASEDDDKGSAYVFTKPTSGGWVTTTETAKLTAFDKATDDEFGYSVAVDGDTVVAGALYDDDTYSNMGAAYVFVKPNSGGWVTATETAKLTAFDKAADDRFGVSVAVDGSTVVVGAYWDDDNGSRSGSAYVFTKPNSGWVTATETAKLTASDGGTNDYFGASVAVDGNRVVVGADHDHDNASSGGSAYVFTKPNGGWADVAESAKLTASDVAAEDHFGNSIAVDGNTVVIGALHDDDNGLNSGAAYVYSVSEWTDVPDSATGGTNATSYTVTGLTNDDEYDFRIRATNDVGTSPASTTATVTPIS